MHHAATGHPFDRHVEAPLELLAVDPEAVDLVRGVRRAHVPARRDAVRLQIRDDDAALSGRPLALHAERRSPVSNTRSYRRPSTSGRRTTMPNSIAADAMAASAIAPLIVLSDTMRTLVRTPDGTPA